MALRLPTTHAVPSLQHTSIRVQPIFLPPSFACSNGDTPPAFTMASPGYGNYTCFVPSLYRKPTDLWVGEKYLYPCGPFTEAKAATCCWAEATCMTSGICRHPSTNRSQEYYVSGCTDPTGQDPACPPYSHCGPSFSTNIDYVGDSTWQCCFNSTDKPDPCKNPTGVFFKASPPQALIGLAEVDTNGTAHLLHVHVPKKLSPGVIAGIIVASIVVAVILVVLALLLRYCTRDKTPHWPRSIEQESIVSKEDEGWVWNALKRLEGDNDTSPPRSTGK